MLFGLLRSILSRPSENASEGDVPLAPKNSIKEFIKHLVVFDFSDDEEYDNDL